MGWSTVHVPDNKPPKDAESRKRSGAFGAQEIQCSYSRAIPRVILQARSTKVSIHKRQKSPASWLKLKSTQLF